MRKGDMGRRMRILKQGIKYILVFLAVTALLTGLLVSVAMIPRSAIKKNTEESARLLCEKEGFPVLIKGVEGSRIDRYADAILLGIAYQYDSEHPVSSVMWSSYYYDMNQNANENLLEAVEEDLEANQQYLRYWHGSISIIRPLLTILNLKQIYICNGILLIVLTGILLVLLLKNRAFVPAVGIVVGMILTSAWFVPFSLEYTWTYLLMLLFSIIGVLLAFRRKYADMGIFFLVTGMVTNYMDFLTTETLTLTVPLLLILWISYCQEKTFSHPLKTVGKALCSWGAGYAGMWCMKWILASFFLSENACSYVSEHVGERMGGISEVGFFTYFFGGIGRNLRCLFPWEYGVAGVLVGVVLVVFVLYVGYVYHCGKIDKKTVLIYVTVGVLPYIRYIVLNNHSYLHFFFTFRAQFATILALVLILERLTEGRWPGRGRKGRT